MTSKQDSFGWCVGAYRTTPVSAGAGVTWSSGDPSVVSIDANGLVTSVTNGTTEISARADGIEGTVAIAVAQVPSVVTVSSNRDTLVALTDTVRMTAEAHDELGNPIVGATFAWESSDTTVATIDASGLVTAIENGESVVTATTNGVEGGRALVVSQVVSSVETSPSPWTFTLFGDTVRFNAGALDAANQPVLGRGVQWTSDDAGVVTIDSTGLATAISNGSAILSATIEGVSDSVTATVSQVSVEVTPPNATLAALGDTLRLVAVVKDAAGNTTGDSVSWSSSDTTVVTVQATTGLVTAIDNGTATVVARAAGVEDTAAITVAQIVATVIIAPTNDTLTALQDTTILEVTALDSNGGLVSGRPATWTSLAPGIAAIDSVGVVTALSVGEAIISVEVDGIADRVPIVVTQVVDVLEVTPVFTRLTALDENIQLGVMARDANGNPLQIQPPLTWSSSDSSVTTVHSTNITPDSVLVTVNP